MNTACRDPAGKQRCAGRGPSPERSTFPGISLASAESHSDAHLDSRHVHCVRAHGGDKAVRPMQGARCMTERSTFHRMSLASTESHLDTHTHTFRLAQLICRMHEVARTHDNTQAGKHACATCHAQQVTRDTSRATHDARHVTRSLSRATQHARYFKSDT